MKSRQRLSYFFQVTLILMTVLPGRLLAKQKLIASTTDLASIASFIGANLVEVESLVTGGLDIHYVSARPDFIRKVNQADLLVHLGLDAEIGWLPLVLKQSRNNKIQPGSPGYVDASQGIKPLDQVYGEIDRSMGDVHPKGNPHYWTDPVRMIIVAKNISEALQKIDAKNASVYQNNFTSFQEKALSLGKELEELFKPYRGRKIVTYHNEFRYMAERFGFELVGHIEEIPGVSPSTRHLRNLIKQLKNNDVRVIANSPWGNLSYSQRIARETGAEHVIVPIRVGSAQGTEDWFAMMRSSAKVLVDAFQKTAKSTN